jgi:very-short-patch-repair endonuclease
MNSNELTLSEFSSRDYELLRSEFETLDKRFIGENAGKVKELCFSRYPDTTDYSSSSGTGQDLARLKAEIGKKRGKLPLKDLFPRIQDLFLTLKPCVLVSPLAVSKFLPRCGTDPESYLFDTVIFDEASQVPPEDAIPSLLRARQVVVVGDAKQMPPTRFFDSSDDGLDEDEEENAVSGRESILDVLISLVGTCVAESYLTNHYRSLDESLIRYSNHYFYDDRLLTFPSPKTCRDEYGMRSVYLPEGRYRPGKSGGDNRLEADTVVDMVFDSIAGDPSSSLGVVTFNKSQAELIERLIEVRRFENKDPEVEAFFSDERPEPFWVKNLENVQGDERDYMIMSVVYGPTEGSDQVANRFGPINQDGGARRLNVAASRARKRMAVVHSLHPARITAPSDGARLLARFLEFAMDPDGAIEKQVEVNADADFDSPFEESVYRALVQRGYKVDLQIGVSKYRIDLGVQSEDGTRYDLGIECDGKTYHSSPMARESDWQRENYLRGLGWDIHRVWSTSWVKNPEYEIERIEKALNKVRGGAQ